MEKQPKWVYVALVLAAALVVGGYFYFKSQKASQEEFLPPAPEASNPAVSGTLPDINSQPNPLEDLPDINPVGRANPFKDVYTNPFK